MPQPSEALGLYIQRLKAWNRPEPPPLALLHRWERELKLRDADIRTVHQLALTHRRRGLDLLREGKPEFLAELREAVQLEPSDPDFLRGILKELSLYEFGGEDWERLLTHLFTRYLALVPDQASARAELERLFPRFRFRKPERQKAVLAITAGIALGLLLGGGGLTVVWFMVRGGSPPPQPALGSPPSVDWSGLELANLTVLERDFRSLSLGEEPWIVVRGRIAATGNGFSELALTLTLAATGDEDVRRLPFVLASPFQGPLREGESLPFLWAAPTPTDRPQTLAVVRVDRSTALLRPTEVPVEVPLDSGLMARIWPILQETAMGLLFAAVDVSIRNTTARPVRFLVLRGRWMASERELWAEERIVLRALDVPLRTGQVQPVRFRLQLPLDQVPEGDLTFRPEVVREERE